MSETRKRPTSSRPTSPARQDAPVTRRKQAIQRISRELTALGEDLDTILENIRLNLQSRLAAIQDRVAPAPGEEAPPPPLTLDVAEKTLALLDELKIRPKRGRLKDLGRVTELLEALHKGLRHGR